MKQLFTPKLALAAILVAVSASPSAARNATIENALKARPDLSTFYAALVSTGVIDELKEHQPYTVFAPTNDAFSSISQSKYPCFYASQCKRQVAEVLRNHIVPGEKHLNDIDFYKGDSISLFSINDEHLTAAEPYKDNFTVDGKNIVSQNQLAPGILYRINGIIADKKQMAQFETPQVTVVQAAPVMDPNALPPRTAAGSIVSITRTGDAAPVVTTQHVPH